MMTAYRKITITAMLLLIASTLSYSQEGNLGNEQINVVKPYQPSLSDAYKISDIPDRDTSVSYTPDLSYAVTPVKYETVYTITPIKPVKIKDQSIKELYRGFVKGGYGTKNTPYIESFFNALRSKDFDAGVHLSHISSTGKIKGYGYPGMSETGISGFGKKFFDHTILEGKLGYNRSVYHYYGYQDPPDIFSKSDTKHSFDEVHGNFGFSSIVKDKDAFNYNANVGFYGISDNNSNNESGFKIDGAVAKLYDDFVFEVGTDLDFLKYDPKSTGSVNNTIVKLQPRVKGKYGKSDFAAGVNAVGEFGDKDKFRLYPYLRFDMRIVENAFTVFGELNGDLNRSSYSSIVAENPFVGDDVAVANPNTKLDVTGGVKIKMERQLTAIASARYTDRVDELYFINVPTSSTLWYYQTLYDNTKTFNLHGEIAFEAEGKSGATVAADYFTYTTNDLDKPLFKPDFTLTLSGFHHIGEKIYLETQLRYISSRYAKGYGAEDFISMKGYFDGNLAIDYRYSKVLSVFVNLNNFTASKYSRWYQYPSYRFSGMLGLSWSF